MSRMRDKSVWYRGKYYFIRGHQQWWYIPLMLANILIIFYGIGGTVIPSLLVLFPTFELFVLVTAPAYLVICAITGWWDFKRGAFKTEQEVWWEDNPLTHIINDGFERMYNRIDIRLRKIEEQLELLDVSGELE